MSGSASQTMWEIPLTPNPQKFYITLGGTEYQFIFTYRNVVMGGWILDIYDNLGNPIVCGIPLVTGANLLLQYVYLGFTGGLTVVSDGDPDVVPTFDNLGQIPGGHLYWVQP